MQSYGDQQLAQEFANIQIIDLDTMMRWLTVRASPGRGWGVFCLHPIKQCMAFLFVGRFVERFSIVFPDSRAESCERDQSSKSILKINV